MKVRRLGFGILCAWLGLARWAVAQQYPFVPIKASNAPSNIMVLFQDSIGRIWTGTTSDLACFDGSRFFYLRDFGFPDTEVLSVAEDDQRGIWIASRAGLHRFAEGRLDLVQRLGHDSRPSQLRQPVTREVDQHLPHGMRGDRVEMLAVANRKAALAQASQSHFIDESRRGNCAALFELWQRAI